MRTVAISFSLALILAAAAACNNTSSSEGDFGEAKPTKDNGMVGKPQPVDTPPQWDTAVAVVPAFDAATKTLTVTLQIKPGFHAYGPGETVSKPVALTVDAQNGWAVDGAVDIPAGQKKDLGDLGTSIILEGDVAMKAKLTGGTGAISGVVEAQVCTDKACDRPRKHPFTIAG